MPGLGIGIGINTGIVGDPDVSSFISRTGITNGTQISASNKLVQDLKTASLWPKFFAIYPIVGGTAQAHSQNLKANQFNITWVNAPTQSANGVNGNGTTQYGRCVGLTSTVTGALMGLGVYVKTVDAVSNFSRMFGATNAGQTSFQSVERVNLATFESERAFNGAAANNAISASVPARNGMWHANRTSSTNLQLYRNGVSQVTQAAADGGVLAAHDIFILGLNQAETPTELSTATIAFAAVNQGLTAPETLAFYNIVQAFQTTLGRQV